MAQMYPTPMDPHTISQTERTLYALFREQLDDAYLVFHSVTWLWAGEKGAARDGEADFVIVHPVQGVLVLEVKGGGIARSKRTGIWTSIGHDGTVYQIKNPLQQAKTNKFALLQVLKASVKHYVVIGHAVAFPDIQVGSEPSRLILICHQRFSWTSLICHRWPGGSSRRCGIGGMTNAPTGDWL